MLVEYFALAVSRIIEAMIMFVSDVVGSAFVPKPRDHEIEKCCESRAAYEESPTANFVSE